MISKRAQYRRKRNYKSGKLGDDSPKVVKIKWTSKASSDLSRFYYPFLESL